MQHSVRCPTRVGGQPEFVLGVALGVVCFQFYKFPLTLSLEAEYYVVVLFLLILCLYFLLVFPAFWNLPGHWRECPHCPSCCTWTQGSLVPHEMPHPVTGVQMNRGLCETQQAGEPFM